MSTDEVGPLMNAVHSLVDAFLVDLRIWRMVVTAGVKAGR
jgi:hypothetical protein